uniref:PRC domain-containing protein n=1 Tax=Macrostomum lignano TaxID=282301 RepID=A0A1I8F9L5_9PLAT
MDLTFFLSVVLFIAIALLLGLLVYSGLLADITVEARRSPYDELLVFYKSHIGPYSNVGDLFRETQQLAPAASSLASIWTIQTTGVGGYVRKTLPKADNVVYCTFPMINKEKGLTARPFIEIHEAGRIVFLAPLSRYEEFQPDISAPAATAAAAPAPVPVQSPRQENPAEASTEELISEAVAENTESAAPPSGSRFEPQPTVETSQSSVGGEVETVFENRQDLLEAMADRPDEEAPLRLDGEDANADKNANADSSEPAGEGDESLEAFEQRLARLEEDLTDKQSRVRSDVSQFNNSLALAEIEEHLRPHRTGAGEEEAAAAAETEPQQAGATFDMTKNKPAIANQTQMSPEEASGRSQGEPEPTPDSVPLIVLEPAEPLAQRAQQICEQQAEAGEVARPTGGDDPGTEKARKAAALAVASSD